MSKEAKRELVYEIIAFGSSGYSLHDNSVLTEHTVVTREQMPSGHEPRRSCREYIPWDGRTLEGVEKDIKSGKYDMCTTANGGLKPNGQSFSIGYRVRCSDWPKPYENKQKGQASKAK